MDKPLSVVLRMKMPQEGRRSFFHYPFLSASGERICTGIYLFPFFSFGLGDVLYE